MRGEDQNLERTFKIAFVISSNLTEWAGVEHVLYEYTLRRPENVKIVIVQAEQAETARVSEKFIYEQFIGIEIKSISNPFNKFRFLTESRFGFLLHDLILMPIFSFLHRNFLNKNFLFNIGNPDIIYFFDNYEANMFVKSNDNILFVGSEHDQNFLVTDFLKKIQVTLIQKRFLFRNINLFHLFPASQCLIPHERAFILPNGVDTNKFTPTFLKGNNPRVLFLARMEMCKGISIILDVWNQLQSLQEIEFHIAGSGSMAKLVESINDKNFTYYGFIEEERLSEVISNCNIFAYPSICDSYPLVVLQALSSGLYVITNRKIASNFEAFEQIGQLKVVENKASEYVKAIKEYLLDQTVFDSQFSRSMCCNEYDWSVISNKLYTKMISEFEVKKHIE